MVYSSVLAAVVSALAAETIDNTAKQAWQKLVDSSLASGFSRSGIAPDHRREVDCWVFSRLHSQLASRHWHALVAKYSTHKVRKVEAIGRLAPVIASHASPLFVRKAVTAWAIPPLKGKRDVKRSTDMIVLPAAFYDMNGWDLTAASEPTRRRWRIAIRRTLDEMVGEALQRAEEVLEGEGLLLSDVA